MARRKFSLAERAAATRQIAREHRLLSESIRAKADELDRSAALLERGIDPQAEAEALARATGSREVTVTHERRELDGSLTVEGRGTYPRPSGPARRCEAFSATRGGLCDRELDELGQCDRASEHR